MSIDYMKCSYSIKTNQGTGKFRCCSRDIYKRDLIKDNLYEMSTRSISIPKVIRLIGSHHQFWGFWYIS